MAAPPSGRPFDVVRPRRRIGAERQPPCLSPQPSPRDRARGAAARRRLVVDFDRWTRRPVDSAERRGACKQTVFQVDASPRYAGLGRWQHNAAFSSWISGDTWRPLPHREWTVRRDYQVLTGTDRHTVEPTGWLQEENNLEADGLAST